jgi:hypothetical protein
MVGFVGYSLDANEAVAEFNNFFGRTGEYLSTSEQRGAVRPK